MPSLPATSLFAECPGIETAYGGTLVPPGPDPQSRARFPNYCKAMKGDQDDSLSKEQCTLHLKVCNESAMDITADTIKNFQGPLLYTLSFDFSDNPNPTVVMKLLRDRLDHIIVDEKASARLHEVREVVLKGFDLGGDYEDNLELGVLVWVLCPEFERLVINSSTLSPDMFQNALIRCKWTLPFYADLAEVEFNDCNIIRGYQLFNLLGFRPEQILFSENKLLQRGVLQVVDLNRCTLQGHEGGEFFTDTNVNLYFRYGPEDAEEARRRRIAPDNLGMRFKVLMREEGAAKGEGAAGGEEGGGKSGRREYEKDEDESFDLVKDIWFGQYGQDENDENGEDEAQEHKEDKARGKVEVGGRTGAEAKDGAEVNQASEEVKGLSTEGKA